MNYPKHSKKLKLFKSIREGSRRQVYRRHYRAAILCYSWEMFFGGTQAFNADTGDRFFLIRRYRGGSQWRDRRVPGTCRGCKHLGCGLNGSAAGASIKGTARKFAID